MGGFTQTEELFIKCARMSNASHGASCAIIFEEKGVDCAASANYIIYSPGSPY